ncbi:MAG: ABC transporter permease, partial [Alphaproteobacteria bacterium]|nr:ABC transporter permease [Alphaproteobacteria bacterium]
MAEIDHQAELTRAGANVSGHWSRLVFYTRQHPLGAVGAAIVIVFVFSALFANVLAPHDPLHTSAPDSLKAPDATFIMGADMMGRDMLSRIIHGARISLTVGVASILLGGVIGIVIGLMSGYLLGWFDLLMQRLIDIMQALPLLVLALVMAASLGPSLENT